VSQLNYKSRKFKQSNRQSWCIVGKHNLHDQCL